MRALQISVVGPSTDLPHGEWMGLYLELGGLSQQKRCCRSSGGHGLVVLAAQAVLAEAPLCCLQSAGAQQAEDHSCLLEPAQGRR